MHEMQKRIRRSRSYAAITARRLLISGIILATLGGCVSETELLNSERIEQRFGSYGITVLSNDAGLRRSNLYSIENGVKTCRTYAIVQFPQNHDQHYAREHQEVLKGGSLGAVFRANGWHIEKQTVHIGSLATRANDSTLNTLMQIQPDHGVALHVYRLLVSKNGDTFRYATIAEAHHPEYLTTSDLQSIFTFQPDNALAPGSVSQIKALFLEN